MGFLDTLKSKKEEYIREENARQQAMIEERQRRQQAQEDQERELYEKIANSALIRDLVKESERIPWFAESQGSWDGNRRQVIIAKKAIVINNYLSDAFANRLKEIVVENRDIEYIFEQKKTGMLDSYVSNKLGVQSVADSQNDAFQRELESYRQSENYSAIVTSFEWLGYEDLSGSIHKTFAIILRQKLQEKYPEAIFTEVRWNKYCAYVFELMVEPKERKSIF